MHLSYFSISGVLDDLSFSFLFYLLSLLESCLFVLDSFDLVFCFSVLVYLRFRGISVLDFLDMVFLSFSGLLCRSSGFSWDVRFVMVYECYAFVFFELFFGFLGDAFDRLLLRLLEVRCSFFVVFFWLICFLVFCFFVVLFLVLILVLSVLFIVFLFCGVLLFLVYLVLLLSHPKANIVFFWFFCFLFFSFFFFFFFLFFFLFFFFFFFLIFFFFFFFFFVFSFFFSFFCFFTCLFVGCCCPWFFALWFSFSFR